MCRVSPYPIYALDTWHPCHQLNAEVSLKDLECSRASLFSLALQRPFLSFQLNNEILWTNLRTRADIWYNSHILSKFPHSSYLIWDELCIYSIRIIFLLLDIHILLLDLHLWYSADIKKLLYSYFSLKCSCACLTIQFFEEGRWTFRLL